MMRTSVILVLIGAAAGGTAYYAKHTAADPATSFRTVAVKRGDLLSTISATGTVEPEEVVDVGAQVAGLIVEFGADPHDPTKLIDYGSVVEKGTVLARIDPTPYEAALEQAEANAATGPKPICCNSRRSATGGAGVEAGREAHRHQGHRRHRLRHCAWPTTSRPRPTWRWERRPSARTGRP